MKQIFTSVFIKVSALQFSILAIWLFISLSGASSYSQSKFYPGYVLLKSGDTLNGYIQTETWRKAPQFVRFKDSPSGEVRTYSPLLAHSFRIKGGEWYFGYVGNIDPSSLLDNGLTYNPEPDTMHVSLFIRAVVIGKASLYYARDENDRMHLFLQKDGGPVRELNYTKYYRDEVVVTDYRAQITRRSIMSNQIYKKQLADAFADCRALSSRIYSVAISYSKNALTDWVDDYNRCKESPSVFKEEKEKWGVGFSVLAGINQSSLTFESSASPYYGNTKVDNNLGFAAGIALNCIVPRAKDAWSIYNELLVRNFRTTGKTGFTEFVEQQNLSLDLVHLKLASMVRYQFPKGAVKPFLNAGMMNGISLKSENLATAPGGEVTDFFPEYRNYEQGIILGGGVTWNQVSTDVRVEFSNGMSGYPAIKTAFRTFYVLAGYTF